VDGGWVGVCHAGVYGAEDASVYLDGV
jgi:hypothetical protein